MRVVPAVAALAAFTISGAAAERFPIPFSPFVTQASIEGRQITIPVSGQATAADLGHALEIEADIIADLSDLRAQLGAIVQAKVNRESCEEVLRVHTVDLRAEPPRAMLSASAHYERRLCVFGSPQGTVEQNGDIRVKVTPSVIDDAIALSFEVVDVDLDGVLGALLQTDIFGPWLIDQLQAMLPRNLTVGRFRDALPPALKSIPATLSAVSIVDAGNGTPAIRGTLRMTVGPEEMRAILTELR